MDEWKVQCNLYTKRQWMDDNKVHIFKIKGKLIQLFLHGNTSVGTNNFTLGDFADLVSPRETHTLLMN